jgi:hypothetical protein
MVHGASCRECELANEGKAVHFKHGCGVVIRPVFDPCSAYDFLLSVISLTKPIGYTLRRDSERTRKASIGMRISN